MVTDVKRPKSEISVRPMSAMGHERPIVQASHVQWPPLRFWKRTYIRLGPLVRDAPVADSCTAQKSPRCSGTLDWSSTKACRIQGF